ncbi:hypothetical protein [Streptomyces fractus]|uniref:hypothetical protein n=1 Tax=Streptomyces fractus TaxID=641806 RepID=UPI003CE7F222
MDSLRADVERIAVEHGMPAGEAKEIADEVMEAVSLAVSRNVTPEQYNAELTRTVVSLLKGQQEVPTIVEHFQRIQRRQWATIIAVVVFLVVWSLWLRPLLEPVIGIGG